VKTRILTDNERKIINAYLESKTKLEGFRMLLSRCRKNIRIFEEDLSLIDRFLNALGEK
jgi:hypothetical protein